MTNLKCEQKTLEYLKILEIKILFIEYYVNGLSYLWYLCGGVPKTGTKWCSCSVTSKWCLIRRNTIKENIFWYRPPNSEI